MENLDVVVIAEGLQGFVFGRCKVADRFLYSSYRFTYLNACPLDVFQFIGLTGRSVTLSGVRPRLGLQNLSIVLTCGVIA